MNSKFGWLLGSVAGFAVLAVLTLDSPLPARAQSIQTNGIFGGLLLGGTTNIISDNGTTLTRNGSAISGGGGIVGTVSNSVAQSGLLAVDSTKTNGVTATFGMVTNALGYFPLTNSFGAVTNALGYLPATNGATIATAANWVASGTTNSTLSGNATANGLTATNLLSAPSPTNDVRSALGAVSVTAYGAVGDGSTDDAAAFQAALNAAHVVYVPYTTNGYLFASGLTMSSNTMLVGVGGLPRLSLKWPNATVTMLSAPKSGVRISNLDFYGAQDSSFKSDTTLLGRDCISINAYGKGNQIDHCYIHGFNGKAIVAASSDSVDVKMNPNLQISDCNILYSFYGLSFEAGSQYVQVTGTRVEACRYGVRMQEGNDSFANCHIVNNGWGFYISNGVNSGHGNIVGCDINHNTYSIEATGLPYGFQISGNSMWEGTLVFTNSYGIIMTGNTMAPTALKFGGGGKNILANNIIASDFATYPSAVTHAYGGTADNTLLYNNVIMDAGGTQLTNSIALNGTYYAVTSNNTVTNTVTATSILSGTVTNNTLPIGIVGAGKTVRVNVRGTITATNSPTLNVRLLVDGSAVCSTGAMTITPNATNNTFRATAEFACRTAGSSGTAIASGEFSWFDNSTGIAGQRFGMPATSTFTLNTAAAISVDVDATWGTADPNNVITGQIGTVEVLNL